MIRRAVARLLTVLALLAASVAWAGWVYLHTAGDPSRMPRVAHAVLDDPSARGELADAVASAGGHPPHTAPAPPPRSPPPRPAVDRGKPTPPPAVGPPP